MIEEKNIRPGSLVKKSFYEVTEHSQDALLHTGFDYRGKLFDKSLSSYITDDPGRSQVLTQMSGLFEYLIDRARSIKRHFNFTVDKNYQGLN